MKPVITATLVQALRARTGAGMMDCKKALSETNGDLELAVEFLQKAGQMQADKKASRVAAEGLIAVTYNSERAVLLEVNCETDFVSRDDHFKVFTEQLAQLLSANLVVNSVDDLLACIFAGADHSVEAERQQLVAKLGENIQIRRLAVINAHPGIHVGGYVHMGRVGVIIELQGGDQTLAKDLAMHIVANDTLAISVDDLTPEMLASKRALFAEQLEASGKPAAVLEKMVNERLEKFIDESILLRQPFMKDPSITVQELLKRANAKVLRFERFVLGEGIEKQVENFAETVMAQIKSS